MSATLTNHTTWNSCCMFLCTMHFVRHLHTMQPFEYDTASGTDTQVKTKHNFRLLLTCQWDLCSFGILCSRVVPSYQHFGTTYQSHLQGSSGETSVQNYHSMLSKIAEECRSQVKLQVIIPFMHKLCYHSCLNIQFHVNHMALSNHNKMEINLMKV